MILKLLRLFLLLSALMISGQVAYAQNEDVFDAYRQRIDNIFETRRKNDDQRFEEYRRKINEEFAGYLERRWAEITMYDAVPVPKKPTPIPCDTPSSPRVVELPSSSVEITPEPISHPDPIAPIQDVRKRPSDDTNSNSQTIFEFDFFGNPCKVHLPITEIPYLPSSSNEEIANIWKLLCADSFNAMLVDCMQLRDRLNLCDWALYVLSKTISDEYCKNNSNTSSVVQIFILTQLGYKARLIRSEGIVEPILAFKDEIYSAPYIVIDESNFYYFGDRLRDSQIETCNFQFPGEQELTVVMNGQITCQGNLGKARSYRVHGITCTIRPNNDLIAFYTTYPACRWDIQANASLSAEVKKQLYPLICNSISGKSEVDAAGIILNFVQTAFEYMTDDEQFGYEKSFFADEMFYYPYNDCEDRSILFAVLIRDILKLDVVLVDYPLHIATAVKFTDGAHGDYFVVDGQPYTMCDPTYIGAPVGVTMPEMLKEKPSLLKVQ